jgi:hypothetical protein
VVENASVFDTKTDVVKGKVLPVHAMKAYRGRRGIAPLILILGTKWM